MAKSRNSHLLFRPTVGATLRPQTCEGGVGGSSHLRPSVAELRVKLGSCATGTGVCKLRLASASSEQEMESEWAPREWRLGPFGSLSAASTSTFAAAAAAFRLMSPFVAGQLLRPPTRATVGPCRCCCCCVDGSHTLGWLRARASLQWAGAKVLLSGPLARDPTFAKGPLLDQRPPPKRPQT